MNREPRWISKTAAVAIHQMLLAAHGGTAGLRDEGLLESALASPRNRFLHEPAADVFELAATYAHAVTRNHPFVDGNKRVALTLAGVFLELNGYRLDASEAEAVRATLGLSRSEIDKDGFAQWLRDASTRLPRRPGGRSRRETR